MNFEYFKKKKMFPSKYAKNVRKKYQIVGNKGKRRISKRRRALFSCYLRLDIRFFVLLPKKYQIADS